MSARLVVSSQTVPSGFGQPGREGGERCNNQHHRQHHIGNHRAVGGDEGHAEIDDRIRELSRHEAADCHKEYAEKLLRKNHKPEATEMIWVHRHHVEIELGNLVQETSPESVPPKPAKNNEANYRAADESEPPASGA